MGERWLFSIYIMAMFNKLYNLKIILVIIVLLLHIDVVYALRLQIGGGLPRVETTIDEEAYKEIAGLPVTYTNDFEKTGLRVSCIQFMNQGFINNTSHMIEIVLKLAELGNDAPDLVIFPEVADEFITKNEADQREKEFKELAGKTDLSIGYFCNIYSPEINILYYIIKPDEVIKFKKFFYENRVVSIGGYKVAILICLEAHSLAENNVGGIEIVSKDIREHEPDLLIIPAWISKDLAKKSLYGLYEKFGIPVALINTLDSSIKAKTSFVISGNPEETISLSRDKERILMVDMPETQFQPLKGPFRVDTEEGRRLCYVNEVTNLDEKKKTLEGYFKSTRGTFFEESAWRKDIDRHPYGTLLKLESDGEILGMALFYKENFTKSTPYYCLDLIEISEKYREQYNLGEILVAKMIEIINRDPEIGDKLAEVNPFLSREYWIEKIKAVPVDDDIVAIYASGAREILQEAKNRIVNTLLVKTKLGKTRLGTYEKWGFHGRAAQAVKYTIEDYKKIINEELGSDFKITVFARNITKNFETGWWDLSDLISFGRLHLYKNDGIEIDLEWKGNLPEEVVKFIIENIKRAFEDGDYAFKEKKYIIKEEPYPHISDSVGELKNLISGLKSGKIKIPPKNHNRDL